MNKEGYAPGKVIVSGEYAVLFGMRGIAVPASKGITVQYEENPLHGKLDITWSGEDGGELWHAYLWDILHAIEQARGMLLTGTLNVNNELPLGKGMGSSTALVIACCRCILGPDCEREALAIEDKVNPGHSGVDFAAIWMNEPILFRRGDTPESAPALANILHDAVLIDTGTPEQTTPQLIAWVREREQELMPVLETIGDCTEQLAEGKDASVIIKNHHNAQMQLGVVPQEVQRLITKIEEAGGAAKVVGAGGKTGGGGMVLALQIPIEDIEAISTYPLFTLVS